ncbi:MAG TPA: agmatine deiminase family protein [Bryobacteraceae bacterium]|nr:agmatine deiminase family protein [Bryobacteraceae bacterium]
MKSKFFMPAEWEPHEATWLAWPHEESDWPGKFEAITWVYGEIVRHLSRYERVRILTQHREEAENVRSVLRQCGANMVAVEFFSIPTDRSWTRDFCPTFVRDTESNSTCALDWRFNGWAKYDNHELDDAVPAQVAGCLGLSSAAPAHRDQRVVLEGGSIDVNGAGTLLTTEECLLSQVQARNPGFSRDDYQDVFHRYLGVTNTLWLHKGIAGDDTHGHIDDIARFIATDTIVVASEEDTDDTNCEPLRENLAILREMRDQDGIPLRVETLPMPDPVYFDGQRLPASYANFYIANNIVLVPTFNDSKDRLALNTLANLFPEHQVIGIASTDLVLGLGTLHCMTQQQPI